MLWNDDNQEAERLIDFALTIKGADKGVLYVKKSQYLEKCGAYKKALKALKEAKRVTYNNDYLYTIDQEKERIKGKFMPKEKKKEKGKKSYGERKRKNNFHYAKLRMRNSVSYLQCNYEKEEEKGLKERK